MSTKRPFIPVLLSLLSLSEFGGAHMVAPIQDRTPRGPGRGTGHAGKTGSANTRRYRNPIARASRVAQLKRGNYR